MGQYDNLFNGVKTGDIHLFRGWFGDSRNTDVKRLNQDVDYLRKAPAVQLKDLTVEKALQSTEPITRYAALTTVKADDKDSILLILKMISTEKDWVVQKQMIALLGASGEEKSIPVLISILKDKSRNLDYFAARALGKIGIPATGALIELLSDKDSRIVEKSLLALSMYQDEKSLPAILPLTEHKNLSVGAAATRALGKYKNAESVDKLIALLDSDKPEIIMAACASLGEIKDKKACKPLVDTIVKAVTVLKNNNLRAAAGDALESITGLEYGPHEQRWKKALADGKI
jgi:HEAT repeat protein